MAQILVRNVDVKVVEKLKTRARAQGRSLQAEAKAILEREAEMLDMGEAWQLVEKVRKGFGGKRFSDSAVLIRKDRGR